MKLVSNSKIEEILDSLSIKYSIISDCKLKNKKFVFDDNLNFYISDDRNTIEIHIIDIDHTNIFKIDFFQHPFIYDKKIINKNDILQLNNVDENEPIYSYVRVNSNNVFVAPTIEYTKKMFEQKHQVMFSDVRLLVAGKGNIKNLVDNDNYNYYTDIKNKFFDEHIKNELINNDFASDIIRKFVNYAEIIIDDDVENCSYKIPAMIELVIHNKTSNCIIDISIPIAVIGATKIINFFNPGYFTLKNIGSNKRITINQFANEMGIKLTGKRKSIVYSLEKIDKEEITNLLCNQEYVGTDSYSKNSVIGYYKMEANNDISQYDYEEEYISYNTLIEVYKEPNLIYGNRVESELQDAFIVELILFLDSALHSIYLDILSEQQNLINDKIDNISIENSLEKLDNMSIEMAKALNFADYDMFNFPIMRKFAQMVANKFEVDSIFEKYKNNKELLIRLIDIIKRKKDESIEKVRNGFLELIAGVQLFATVGSVIVAFYGDLTTIKSYCIALAFISMAYIIYKFILFYKKRVKGGSG